MREEPSRRPHGSLDVLETHRKKPLASLFERFPTMTADLAARMGKRIADLTGDGRLACGRHGRFRRADRLVRPPRSQHGRSWDRDPAERQSKGKPQTGNVSIDIRDDEKQIVFTFADDGRGIQLDKVEKRARQLGLIEGRGR